MATLKTVIFVDGENFRNNLRAFSFQSTPPHPTNPVYKLEEKHFFWKDFFDSILTEFNRVTGWSYRLIRVYWYYSANISPWVENSNAAQKIVGRYASVAKLTISQVNQLAKEWYDHERRYFEKLREEVFPKIQESTDFLEFKYVGQYIIRPYSVYRIDFDSKGNVVNYLGYQQGEKGVDVGIAMDMVAKMQNYDVAILVSGDADFLPAVRYLKDNLKYVYQFSIAKGVPPAIKYLSPYLKGNVDCFAYFDEIQLLSNFLDRRQIPLPIVQAIDARIATLQGNQPPP